MSTADELLRQGTEEAVRRVCIALLDEARTTLPRLDDPTDTEALHDFRVAVRRLRSTVRAWREVLGKDVGRKHRAKLKALQNETGGGRDSEVALEWIEEQTRGGVSPAHRLGVQWITERLQEQKRAAMSHVRSAIRTRYEKLESVLRPRLATMTQTLHIGMEPGEPRFAEALAEEGRRHAEALAARLVPITSVEQEEQLHDVRIAGKRLRYLLEPAKGSVPEVGKVLKTCKKLQELLGQLNDGFVLRAILRGALEDAAVERARLLHELARRPESTLAQREMRRTERPGLLELTRRNEERIRSLYARIESDWIETAAAPLIGSIEEMARALGALDGKSSGDVEIERKYLLSHLPDLSGMEVEVLDVEQGYLPGKTIRERVRRTVDAEGRETFYRTLKAGKGVQRIEVEERCDAATFAGLWALTDGARVRKRRFVVRSGNRAWELDVFTDRELFLAEIELASVDEPVDFPSWLEPALVREVTEEKGFTNLELAS